jgi:hypothetical protein
MADRDVAHDDPVPPPEVVSQPQSEFKMYHPVTMQHTTILSLDAVRAWELRGWVLDDDVDGSNEEPQEGDE